MDQRKSICRGFLFTIFNQSFLNSKCQEKKFLQLIRAYCLYADEFHNIMMS
jgi:hypothetical protein